MMLDRQNQHRGSPHLVCLLATIAVGVVSAASHARQASATAEGQIVPTFFGGSDDDRVADLLVLPDGDLIVVGRTESEDLPGVAGAVDDDYGAAGPGSTKNDGGDGFVARLYPDGATVRWASYVGGEGTDGATAVASMPDGGFLVVGHTSSNDFPVTTDALDARCGKDGCLHYMGDAFISHWGPEGRLRWATYLGGRQADTATDVAVDARSGAIWVIGESASPDFPVTPSGNAPQASTGNAMRCGRGYRNNTPCTDAFVVRLGPAGERLEHSTMIGGARMEWAAAIALRSDGAPFIGGTTESEDFPTTPGIHDARFEAGYCFPGVRCDDAFIVGLTAAGAIRFATLLGGSDFDRLVDLAVDAADDVLAAGRTASVDLPWSVTPVGLTDGHYGQAFPTYQGFVARLSGDGTRLHDLVRLAGPHEGLDLHSVQAVAQAPDGGWVLAVNAALPRGIRRDELRHSGPVVLILTLAPRTLAVRWARDLGAMPGSTQAIATEEDGTIVVAADARKWPSGGGAYRDWEVQIGRFTPDGIGVSGRILDADDTPLTGESLTVSPARSGSGSPVLVPFTATSGPNGTWSMDGLPDAPLIVRPTGPGPWSPPFRHVSASSRVGIDFRRGSNVAPPRRSGDVVLYLPWGTYGVRSPWR